MRDLLQLLLRQAAEVQLLLDVLRRHRFEVSVHVQQIQRPTRHSPNQSAQIVDILAVCLWVLERAQMVQCGLELTLADVVLCVNFISVTHTNGVQALHAALRRSCSTIHSRHFRHRSFHANELLVYGHEEGPYASPIRCVLDDCHNRSSASSHDPFLCCQLSKRTRRINDSPKDYIPQRRRSEEGGRELKTHGRQHASPTGDLSKPSQHSNCMK